MIRTEKILLIQNILIIVIKKCSIIRKKVLEIKEEYEKIKNQAEKTYFDSLHEKKEKIIGFYGNNDTNDEETKGNSTIICIQDEDSQRAEEIIDKIIQRKKSKLKEK